MVEITKEALNEYESQLQEGYDHIRIYIFSEDQRKSDVVREIRHFLGLSSMIMPTTMVTPFFSFAFKRRGIIGVFLDECRALPVDYWKWSAMHECGHLLLGSRALVDMESVDFWTALTGDAQLAVIILGVIHNISHDFRIDSNLAKKFPQLAFKKFLHLETSNMKSYLTSELSEKDLLSWPIQSLCFIEQYCVLESLPGQIKKSNEWKKATRIVGKLLDLACKKYEDRFNKRLHPNDFMEHINCHDLKSPKRLEKAILRLLDSRVPEV